MNVASMKQWTACEAPAIAWIRQLLRCALDRLLECDMERVAYRAFHAAVAAPSYWILNNKEFVDLPDGRVPSAVSSAAKLAAALVVVQARTFRASGSMLLRNPRSGGKVYETINDLGLLIGKSEVCPAPRQRIERVLSLILTGPLPQPSQLACNVAEVAFQVAPIEYCAFLYDLIRLNELAKLNAPVNPAKLSSWAHPLAPTALHASRLMAERSRYQVDFLRHCQGSLKVGTNTRRHLMCLEQMLVSEGPKSQEATEEHSLAVFNAGNEELARLNGQPFEEIAVEDLRRLFGPWAGKPATEVSVF